MKWNKYTIKTVSGAEDVISAILADLGVQGVEIEDKQPLTEQEKQQMFVDILPELPEDDGVAYVNFYLEPGEDNETVLRRICREMEELRAFMEIGEGSIADPRRRIRIGSITGSSILNSFMWMTF